ncbi:uncharacterized protein LOC130663914 [Microplitis mediator]|uniref:uncharacterized protein LOC130663914 n=1 Tax=Microplitis mediator TaxID=375433 RepID=UPI002556A327|nr:uncharacterized protein LOC130663914 [Microplitis mediator]
MNGISSSEESTDEEEILRNFDAEASLIIQSDTLPKKSADRYILNYETYKNWQKEHESSLSNSEESNLIVYFKELTKKLSPSTIWGIWSMLKKTLNTRENIDISKFQNLKSLVKGNSKSYKSKKSLVLKWDEIMKFMNDAPDKTHLDKKVLLIFGICGALRCKEISELKITDVEDLGNRYLVSVNETKNDVPRQFIIGGLFREKVKQYALLRPKERFSDKFFVQYRNGKCVCQNIGRNTIGGTPQSIASYLNLPNPTRYTGHCFRRTSATLLSESGANVTILRQLGGWKSTAIAQGYVENSLKNREKIFQKITHAAVSNIQNNPQPSTSAKCSTNINFANNNQKSTGAEEVCDHFSEDFDFSAQELAAIDNLNQFEVPKSPTTAFTAANKEKIPSTPNKQLKRFNHFTTKSPVDVFSKGQENPPPIRKNRIISDETIINEKSLNSASTANTTCNRYENCVFRGNIINNFYYSCNH